MAGIKEIKLKEYKNSIVLFIGISLLILLLYYLFYTPLINYLDKKDEIVKFALREKRERKILEAGERRYSRLEEELSKEREKVEESKKRVKAKSFFNLVDFEEHISEVGDRNLISIETIGRVEKIEESDKIYVPYIVSGDLKGIENFIEELEESDKGISLGETMVILEVGEEKGKLICKMSANVLNIRENEEIKEKRLKLREFLRYKIKEIKTINYNNKNYIIVNYQKGGREIFYCGEILEQDGKKYEIYMEKGEIFLKNTK